MCRDAIAVLAPNLVAQPLRVALTGLTVSPGIFGMLVVLGPDESTARLQAAATWISRHADVC